MMRKLVFVLLMSAAGLAGAQTTLSTAVFAMGCFWCGEEALEVIPGVVSVVSGYTDGKTQKPSYEMVSSGTTGHTEAVEVKFDPSKVSYEKLLDTFWLNHDPTVTDRRLTPARRALLRTISSWRYALRLYAAPYELRALHALIHYQRPETTGF